MIEWTTVLTGVVSAGAIGAITGMAAIARCVHKVYRTVERMERNGEKRKNESLLLIEGQLGLIDAVRTGKTNGNLSDIEKKLKTYIRETAVN